MSKLTLEDPIDSETLTHFKALRDTRLTLSETFVNLELEKIRVLAAIKELDKQNARLFERCVVDRGLPPETEIDLDSETGRITIAT